MRRMGDNIRTYEELLVERINKALTALDNESYTQFDQIMEDTLVLLKIKQGLSDLYLSWKNHYGKNLQLAYEQIDKIISGIDDPYDKVAVGKSRTTVAEHGYRLDLLEKLVSLLNDYNLVPFGIPEYAEIQTDVPPEEQPEQPQEPEQPIQKTKEELLAEDMDRLQREEQEIVKQQQSVSQQQKSVRFAPKKNKQ